MSTDRLESLLTFHPFTRLNALLQGVAPGGPGQPLLFSVGEPQMTPPAMLSEILVREAAQWSKYPLAQGTADFRAAAADWLTRRYHLPAGMIDADKQLLPVAGSREGLFMIALSAVPEWAGESDRSFSSPIPSITSTPVRRQSRAPNRCSCRPVQTPDSCRPSTG
jgi:N-succinyldiaminopimelate aminotransferase